MEMYIFSHDESGEIFLNALKERVKSGVKIKLILDSLGSVTLPKKEINELRELGIEVLFFSYWLRRIHRKVLIIDEKVAFLGGVNILEKSKKWNDLHLKIQGALVKRILRSFAYSYRLCGGKDKEIINKWKKTIFRKTKYWLIDHWPISNKLRFNHLYRKNIARAKKSVKIITPYFLPTRKMRASLHQAVLRGVRVEILVPQKVEYKLVTRLNHYYISKLNDLGIIFHIQKHMNHAKAMIIDGERGVIGSQNLDILSFTLNSEIGVFFDDPQMVNRLEKIFEKWVGDSETFDYSKHRNKWYDYLLILFIRLAEPIF